MPTDSGVTVVISATDQSGAVLEETARRLRLVGSEAETTERKIRAAGEHAVPAMAAASASVRALEGNFDHNTRAVERFLSTLPGVEQAMQVAFPIVGALSLGTVLAEEIGKLEDFREKTLQAGDAFEQAFGRLAQSAQLSNDTLKVTNDKLENAIAKLEGKPANGMREAIDEASEAADRLLGKLQADDDKIGEILTKNHVGFLGTLFGVDSTDDLTATFKSYSREIEDIARADQERVRAATTDAERQAATEKLRNDVLDQQRAKLKGLKADIEQITATYADDRIYNPRRLESDQKRLNPRLDILRGEQAQIQAEIDNQEETDRNTRDQKLRDDLERAKENSRLAAEEYRKQQTYLKKIGELGIGEIYQGERNVSAQSRDAQNTKLLDASNKDQQEAIGREGSEYFKNLEEQGAAQLKLSQRQIEARREESEAASRAASDRRQAIVSEAAFELNIGRITSDQKLAIEAAALQEELEQKRRTAGELYLLDAGDPAKQQRDKDEEARAEQQGNQRLIEIDRQAYEERRRAAEPFINDIFQPLLDKPKNASEAFRRMADGILADLNRIAQKKITEQLLGSLLGAPGGKQSGFGDPGLPGGALSKGIGAGGGLGALLGGLFGKKGPAAAAGTVATDTAAKLGAGSGAASVTIINQTSNPVQAASATTGTDQLGNLVHTIILKDAESGGPLTMALGGAFRAFAGG